jgi:hypothetical protein
MNIILLGYVYVCIRLKELCAFIFLVASKQ